MRERLEPRRGHASFLVECFYPRNIDRTPRGSSLARREANLVGLIIDARTYAVDPAKAQGLVHGFLPSDAGTIRTAFVEADDQFRFIGSVLFEPGAELGWGCE